MLNKTQVFCLVYLLQLLFPKGYFALTVDLENNGLAGNHTKTLRGSKAMQGADLLGK